MITFLQYINEKIMIKGQVSKIYFPLYKLAIEYFKNQLNIKSNINIEMSIYKKMKKEFGFIKLTNNVPKTFKIKIEYGGTNFMLNSIVHEMIHVKQIANGELSLNKENEIIWKNKNYGKDPIGIYKTSPWEIEAHMTNDLYVKFLKSKEIHELANTDVNVKFYLDLEET